MEECPKCGGRMSNGAPHDPSYISQKECIDCGHIIPVYRKPESE